MLEKELEFLRRELSNIKNNKDYEKSSDSPMVERRGSIEKPTKYESNVIPDKQEMQELLSQSRTALLQLLANHETLAKGLQVLPNQDEVKSLKAKLAAKTFELEETKKVS